jgi:hypothetical protein
MGRGRRWAIGLVVSGLLGLGAIVSGAVAVGQVVAHTAQLAGGSGDCVVLDVDGLCADDQLTATAQAQVLDVDPTGEDGSSLDAGGFPGEAGSVDVEFDAPDQHVVTTIPWPGPADSLPVDGTQLTVAYAPDDPENLITVQRALDEKNGDGALPPVVSGPGASPAPSAGSAWDDGRGAGWLTLGFGLATVVSLLVTWSWARRAPVPERAQPTGYPGYGYPGYGYGYPYAGYPSYGPPSYDPPSYGPPSYAGTTAAGAAPGPTPDGAGSAGNWPAPG